MSKLYDDMWHMEFQRRILSLKDVEKTVKSPASALEQNVHDVTKMPGKHGRVA